MVVSVDTMGQAVVCYYLRSKLVNGCEGWSVISHKSIDCNHPYMAAMRVTISCANATKAWAPFDEGSNTTPGNP